MADILVTSPFQPFTLPTQFKAVFNGYIYCGTVGAVDPSVSQVQVYLVNEAGDKVPVSQPLRTNAGGFLVYNGQPAKFVTSSNHSLLVRDSLGSQLWYAPNMAEIDPAAASFLAIEALRRSYAEAGYTVVGTFWDGGTLSSPADVLINGGDGKAYSWTGTYPVGGYVVAPNTDPLSNPNFAARDGELLRSHSVLVFPTVDAMKSNSLGNYSVGQALQVVGNGAATTYVVQSGAGDHQLVGGLYATALHYNSSAENITWNVGNDLAFQGEYHFNQLSDALIAATQLSGGSLNNGQFRIRITIPAGTHSFNKINLRGVDLSHVQIWGAGSDQTTVLMEVPNFTSSQVWFDIRFSSLGDIGGIRWKCGASITNTTDPVVVCQRWYVDTTPPWDENTHKTFTFMHLGGSKVSRIWGIKLDASTSGIRLGTVFSLYGGSSIDELDDFEVSNMRDILVVYGNSHLYIGYKGIHAAQVYNFLVNHESTVKIRRVNYATAFNSVNEVSVGSVFVDTFRGQTTLWERGSASTIVSRFDTLFMMDMGDVRCSLSASIFSLYTSLVNDLGTGNNLVIDANMRLPAAVALSATKIMPWSRNPDQHSPYSYPLMGQIEYTGDGTSSGRVVLTKPFVKKATVVEKISGKTIMSVRGVVAKAGTSLASALWISETDGSVRVYGTANSGGVEYYLVWEA